MDWLRWYHGTVSDPKWRVIAKKSGAPIPTVISIWAAMLENASQSKNRGTLSGWNPEDVAECFDVTVETVVTVCNEMQQKVLLHETLTAWEKRNPKRERADNSTDRVRRFRDKKRHETPRNATKRPEQSREEKSREEGEKRGTGGESADAAGLVSFGEFGRAQMTLEQHAKLLARLDGSLESYITDFDRWVNDAPDAKKDGVRRKDRHAYESISAWYDRDVKLGKVKKPKSVERKVVY